MKKEDLAPIQGSDLNPQENSLPPRPLPSKRQEGEKLPDAWNDIELIGSGGSVGSETVNPQESLASRIERLESQSKTAKLLLDGNADEICSLQEKMESAYGYASRLFKSLAPECEPSTNLAILISQLDNYICGLKAQTDERCSDDEGCENLKKDLARSQALCEELRKENEELKERLLLEHSECDNASHAASRENHLRDRIRSLESAILLDKTLSEKKDMESEGLKKRNIELEQEMYDLPEDCSVKEVVKKVQSLTLKLDEAQKALEKIANPMMGCRQITDGIGGVEIYKVPQDERQIAREALESQSHNTKTE